ncbi:hypothetical protein VTL71DRAFT_8399 [Oculimacula yallundae]|uniref:Uncharacterized protein n=1 Tax=Oculimacula yallundae TaxID=86028 RepID=A0ABR4CXL9_9HELO
MAHRDSDHNIMKSTMVPSFLIRTETTSRLSTSICRSLQYEDCWSQGERKAHRGHMGNEKAFGVNEQCLVVDLMKG